MAPSADAAHPACALGTEPPTTPRTFTQRFSSTRRGARLARLLVVERLDAWGIPYAGDLSDSAALVVAELAANAVTHGRVPGRDFEVRVTLGGGVLRIAVSDARGEHLPRAAGTAGCDAGAGRGLLLVAALASRWGVEPRRHLGKTVWAELAPVRALMDRGTDPTAASRR